MKPFFTARFVNDYSVDVYVLGPKDNSPCNFHLVPCGQDGRHHEIVNDCEIKEEQLAATLDYLQMQMELIDNPPKDHDYTTETLISLGEIFSELEK